MTTEFLEGSDFRHIKGAQQMPSLHLLAPLSTSWGWQEKQALSTACSAGLQAPFQADYRTDV